jgi:hypothetical protein
MQSIQPLTLIYILISIFIALLLLSSAILFFCKYLNNQKKCCLTVSVLTLILASIVIIIPISVGFFKADIALEIDKDDLVILKNQGSEIIEQIDSFKKEHGNYPLELSDALHKPQPDECAYCKYKTYKNKTKYKLIISDIGRHYVLSWKSWKHEWVISNS